MLITPVFGFFLKDYDVVSNGVGKPVGESEYTGDFIVPFNLKSVG